jgi:hypothetical protein
LANAYHFQHVKDENPVELSVGTDVSADNYLHYRYFEKTDKCIWINRREGDVDHKQWIKDPLNHLHDVDTHENVKVEPPSKILGEPSVRSSSSLLGDLIPTASAQIPIPSEGSMKLPKLTFV